MISSGFYVDAVQLSTPGVQAVRVYYEGSSCSFNITVGEQAELITGIGVLTLPAKTRYTVGEALDTTGLSIRAYTNSGTGYRDISWDSLICSPSLLNTLGEQEILVVYGDKSCTFTVSVEEAEHPVSLMVQTMPNKISYSVGQLALTVSSSLELSVSTSHTETVCISIASSWKPSSRRAVTSSDRFSLA